MTMFCLRSTAILRKAAIAGLSVLNPARCIHHHLLGRELADVQGGAVQGHGRYDRVHAEAVRQARVNDRAFVNAPAQRADDARSMMASSLARTVQALGPTAQACHLRSTKILFRPKLP